MSDEMKKDLQYLSKILLDVLESLNWHELSDKLNNETLREGVQDCAFEFKVGLGYGKSPGYFGITNNCYAYVLVDENPILHNLLNCGIGIPQAFKSLGHACCVFSKKLKNLEDKIYKSRDKVRLTNAGFEIQAKSRGSANFLLHQCYHLGGATDKTEFAQPKFIRTLTDGSVKFYYKNKDRKFSIKFTGEKIYLSDFLVKSENVCEINMSARIVPNDRLNDFKKIFGEPFNFIEKFSDDFRCDKSKGIALCGFLHEMFVH